MNPPRNNLLKYQSRNFIQQILIRRFFQKVRSFYQSLPSGDLCDVGCGEGFALRDFLDHGLVEKNQITGIDHDENALRFASALVPEASLRQSSIYELPFSEKAFQCVMMLEVLEHLSQPDKALREASRIGRFLLLSIPHEPWFSLANFLRGKNWARFGNDKEHIQRWDCHSFKTLLQPYGTLIRMGTSFPWIIALLKTP